MDYSGWFTGILLVGGIFLVLSGGEAGGIEETGKRILRLIGWLLLGLGVCALIILATG